MASSSRSPSGPVRSSAQDEHLDPESARSKKDQVKARVVADFEREVVVTDDDVKALPYKIESLRHGLAMDGAGKLLAEGQLPKKLKRLRKKLSYRWRRTNKGRGRIGKKREHVSNPIIKETITVSGLHDCNIKALDAMGYDFGPFMQQLMKELMIRWDEVDFASRIVAMVMHPNSGALHFHPVHTRVGDDHFLVNKSTHQGNCKSSRAGIPLIALFRWRQQDLLPEENSVNLDRYMKKRRAKSGCLPPDYLVSLYLDRRVDEKLKEIAKENEIYKTVIERSTREYRYRVERKHLRDRMMRMISDKELTNHQLKQIVDGQVETEIDDHGSSLDALDEALVETARDEVHGSELKSDEELLHFATGAEGGVEEGGVELVQADSAVDGELNESIPFESSLTDLGREETQENQIDESECAGRGIIDPEMAREFQEFLDTLEDVEEKESEIDEPGVEKPDAGLSSANPAKRLLLDQNDKPEGEAEVVDAVQDPETSRFEVLFSSEEEDLEGLDPEDRSEHAIESVEPVEAEAVSDDDDERDLCIPMDEKVETDESHPEGEFGSDKMVAHSTREQPKESEDVIDDGLDSVGSPELTSEIRPPDPEVLALGKLGGLVATDAVTDIEGAVEISEEAEQFDPEPISRELVEFRVVDDIEKPSDARDTTVPEVETEKSGEGKLQDVTQHEEADAGLEDEEPIGNVEPYANSEYIEEDAPSDNRDPKATNGQLKEEGCEQKEIQCEVSARQLQGSPPQEDTDESIAEIAESEERLSKTTESTSENNDREAKEGTANVLAANASHPDEDLLGFSEERANEPVNESVSEGEEIAGRGGSSEEEKNLSGEFLPPGFSKARPAERQKKQTTAGFSYEDSKRRFDQRMEEWRKSPEAARIREIAKKFQQQKDAEQDRGPKME